MTEIAELRQDVRSCDTCKHCGEWVMQQPKPKHAKPYELAVCNSQGLPEYWRANGPMYVMHGNGTQCNLWERK